MSLIKKGKLYILEATMNHKSLLSVCLAILGSVCFGCSGATTQTTITPTATSNVRFIPADNTVVLAGIRNVAIFPFADYSYQQCHLVKDCWGGNIKITEAITDQFTTHGITVAVQEDVNTLLVDEKVIRPIDEDKYLIEGTVESKDTENKKISTPEYEVTGSEHSPDMIDEILRIIDFTGKNKKNKIEASPVIQGVTVGLSKEKIIELGDKLGVDVNYTGKNYRLRLQGYRHPQPSLSRCYPCCSRFSQRYSLRFYQCLRL